MGLWQAVAVAAAALLVFWMLGAYNRLVSLRNAAATAWRAVDDALAARGAVVTTLVEALRAPLAGEAAALEALQSAQARLADAARAMAARPLQADAAVAFTEAEAKVGPACARVLALVEADAAMRQDATVLPSATAWREAAVRLGFAREAFNDAVRAYNDALAQWPTRALVALYGFAPAGRV